ncbi:MAG TPA: bifunctional enoyl-CoA hydratase/phosphate acetyltransferase [Geminicoccaceae bacterium]|nr:bifunctional enoyl-CoA hydratase/phosphate acetyltransferase [Geminicoccus sp.]HMU52757.1 bifunctional enoyl-CoA hydratase/phosphate acetyltransferase [Geminicoccaceae bacterium]
MVSHQLVENRTFDEIEVGETASVSRRLTEHDLASFAAVSGGMGTGTADIPLDGPVAHGMLGGALISTVLGTRLPGPGTLYLRQELDFVAPMHLGDTITVTVKVAAKGEDRQVTLDCACVDQAGKLVTRGRAVVRAPAEKLRIEPPELPQMIVQTHDSFERLMRACRDVPPVSCAVAHPCSPDALEGAIDAAEAGVITLLLVGPAAKVRATAEAAGIDISKYELIDVPHSHAAADRAVELVREGKAQLLMKGSLHTDELMAAVVAKETGLRTGRRLSHVFVMDVPTYPKPLFITDAAINIFPALEDKVDIVRNAIDLFAGLGLGEPKVAILSAVETVNPKIPGTLDAAALCKMADRGQITGGLLDGPLALDNAIDRHAAEIKGITSEVAGQADILVVPDLEAGNMLAKNLSFLAHADAAGVVVGARVPIILTSRADSVRARLASAAVAALYAHNKRLKQPVAA